ETAGTSEILSLIAALPSSIAYQVLCQPRSGKAGIGHSGRTLVASSERHACVLGTLLLFLLFRMKLSANSVPFSTEILASSAVEGRDNSEALWLFSLFPAVFGCILEGFVQKKSSVSFQQLRIPHGPRCCQYRK